MPRSHLFSLCPLLPPAPEQKDGKRVERLRANAAATGGAIIDARHADFLSIDPEAPEYAEVRQEPQEHSAAKEQKLRNRN